MTIKEVHEKLEKAGYVSDGDVLVHPCGARVSFEAIQDLAAYQGEDAISELVKSALDEVERANNTSP